MPLLCVPCRTFYGLNAVRNNRPFGSRISGFLLCKNTDRAFNVSNTLSALIHLMSGNPFAGAASQDMLAKVMGQDVTIHGTWWLWIWVRWSPFMG